MEAQARGGAGIVTSHGAFTEPKGEGKGYVGMMGIWDDKYIPGLKKIADVIKKHDAVPCLQLMHCGRVGGIEIPYTAGPSNVPQKLPNFRPPKEMTKEEIHQCIQEHIDGAVRAVEAGFKIVEVSGIVGYLLSNFISAYTNKRTDEYGGDIHGRSRFMKEILEGIRKAIPSDVAIGIRLCGEELLDDRGGNTPEESLESIKIADKAGIDYLSVTAGWQESPVSVISRDVPMGNWLYIADQVPNLERGLQILELLLDHPRGLPQSEIASLLHCSKTSVFRITMTFLDHGYLVRDEETKALSLSRKLVAMGSRVVAEEDLLTTSLDVLKSLRDCLRETVLIGTNVETDLVVLGQILGSHPFKFSVDPGTRLPLHRAAPGKAILAFMPPEERGRIVKGLPFARYTERTITDLSRFIQELDQARGAGYNR